MKPELLLEIGCEEIPAAMLPAARASLKLLLEEQLRYSGLLQGEPVVTFGTPRRLVASCTKLALAEPTRTTQILGPPKTVAYDSSGQPTHAAKSFARKLGAPLERLQLVETPKGTYLAAISKAVGRPTATVLAETLPALIPKIDFPRSMYWKSPEDLHFVRPIRWILALWRGKALDFKLAGLPSSATTYGHRLLSSGPIAVRSIAEYRRRLREAGVVVDPADRKAKILKETRRLLDPLRLRVRQDAALLELLVDLVEHPTVILGSFDPTYMELPPEILVTVMRHHQKYLSVETPQAALAPHFLAVIDLDHDRGDEIRRGHQAVLGARFRDAKFFWEADQGRRLEERLDQLEERTFVSGLGNYRQKVERLIQLVRILGENSSAEGRRADISALGRAAYLAKSDLTTEMVGELPELQGVVGGIYAGLQGEPELVARAIYEHHRPSGREDLPPETLEGSLLALADKLDTIAGCFSVGLAPTGSRDPFALRRAGSGVVRIIVERRLRLSVRGAIEAAQATLLAAGIEPASPILEPVERFLEERARHLFQELRQFPYDQVNAAFAAGWDDLVDAAARLEAIRAIRRSRDFEALALAFKRIRNILEQAGGAQRWIDRPINEALLESGAERELYERFRQLRLQVGELRAQHGYLEALRTTASLRPQVDRYFDTVLVMAKEDSLRSNRLALLAHLLQEFSTVADFSEIVVDPKSKE